MMVLVVVKIRTMTMMIIVRKSSTKVKKIKNDTEVSIEQSYFQERLRQQAIKDKEKERTQFYTEQAIISHLLYSLAGFFLEIDFQSDLSEYKNRKWLQCRLYSLFHVSQNPHRKGRQKRLGRPSERR